MPDVASPERLLLVGAWTTVPAHLAALDGPDRTLILTMHDHEHACCARHRPDLMIVRSGDADDALGSVPAPVPWLLWQTREDSASASAALAHGAHSVIPPSADPAYLSAVVYGLLVSRRLPDLPHLPRSYQPGELVRHDAGRIAMVIEGAIAVHRIYASGAEALVDVLGPGRLVQTESPLVRAVALSHARVRQYSPREARDGGWYEDQLEHDLLAAREWSEARATPYLDERILEVLGVLAARFGRTTSRADTIIDLRITHSMLAAAVGASRSAVTRLLSDLRRRGRLDVTSDAQRFVLPCSAAGQASA